jgi:predicted O-methyltransferase YrrM
MSWLSLWLAERRAAREARALLRSGEWAGQFGPAQQEELVRLRVAFVQEKMGRWPERVALYRAAARLPAGATVVEIGSWTGVGTCYLAAGLRSGAGGHVYAVDTFRGTTLDPRTQAGWSATVAKMGGSTLPHFWRHLGLFGLEGLVEAVVEDSVRAAARFAGRQIDLLFIDGDHVYEAVRADFEAWRSLVRPGGLILFHDYDAGHPGVRRLVDEVLAGPLAGLAIERVGALVQVRLREGEVAGVGK